MVTSESGARDLAELLKTIDGHVTRSRQRLHGSQRRFTDEAPGLANRALAELDRVVLPGRRRGAPVIKAAASLVAWIGELDLVKTKIDEGYLATTAALVGGPEQAMNDALASMPEFSASRDELLEIFDRLNEVMGLREDTPNKPLLEVLLDSDEFFEQRGTEEPDADPIIAAKTSLARLQRHSTEVYSKIAERLIVFDTGIVVVYNRIADAFDDRLDVLRTYLDAVSETRGDDVASEESQAVGIVEEVVKEGVLDVAQEYLTHVVPATAIGGFPLIGALFSAAAAAQGVAERRRHRQERREWAERVRRAAEDHNTSDDMWDFHADYETEDAKLAELLEELENLKAALSL